MSKKQKKPMRSFDESVRAGTPVFVADALRRGFDGVGAAMKHPLVLLPAVILLLVQTALSLIKINAPDSTLIHILSLLTFAQGGMYAGFLGKVGGVVGKTLLAGMLTKLLMKNKGQKPPERKKAQGGFFALIIPGLGAGLIAYNFLTGNACLENAMIGVTSAISVFRMAGKPDAFLPGFLRSFRKGKTPAGAAKSVLLGVGVGLAAGVLTSLRGSGYLCYVLGGALLLIGLLLTLLTKSKRAVAVAAVLALCLSPLTGLVSTAQAAGFTYTAAQASQVDTDDAASKLNADFPDSLTAVPVAVINKGKGLTALLSDASSFTINGGTGQFSLSCDLIGFSAADPSVENSGTADFSVSFTDGKPNISYSATRRLYENGGWSEETDPSGSLTMKAPYFAGNADFCGVYSLSLHQALSRQNRVYLILESSISYLIACEVLSAEQAEEPPAAAQEPAESLPAQSENPPEYIPGQANSDWIETPDITAYRKGKLSSFIKDESFTYSISGGVLYDVDLSTPEGQQYVFDLYLEPGETLTIDYEAVAGVKLGRFENYKFYIMEGRGNFFESNGEYYKRGHYNQHYTVLEEGGAGASYTGSLTFTMPAYEELMEDAKQNFYSEFKEIDDSLRPLSSDGKTYYEYWIGTSFGFETNENYEIKQYGAQTRYIEYYVRFRILLPSEAGGAPAPVPVKEPDGTESDFFDNESWLDWEDSGDHTDTEETLVTDAAAVAGGVLAALLTAGGAIGGGLGGDLGGMPPLPDSPYIKRDPDDPSYATLTGPDGVQSLYRYDEASGLWRDPYSDSYLETGQLDRAMQDAQRDRAFSEGVIDRMEERTDAASLRQKQMWKMEQQEERLWAAGGTYGGVLEKKLADQLQKLRRQMIAGGELDVAQYEKVRNAIGKISRGEMLDDSHIAVTSDKWTVSEITEGLALTGREIGASSSWKAWALRGLLAVGTGGASEKGFDLTDALYTMHDSYMAGDGEGKAFAKAVGSYMTGELIGDAAGAGLKKVGGAIADTKVGQKALYYIKDLIDPAAKQADDAAKAAKRLALIKEVPGTPAGSALKPVKSGGDVGAAPKLTAKPKLALEPPQPKSKAPFDSIQSDKRIASLKKDAQADIQRKLDDLRAKQGADPLQAAANKRAAGKVDRLQSALDELKRDPGNPAKRKAVEEAAMSVQQDKAGIRQMKQGENVPSASRQVFNAMKTQKDQIATANTREILAKKFGVKPEQVKSIEPSNTMTTSQLRQVGEADGIYKEPAAGSADGAKRFTEKDFPLDTENASKTGVSSDIDKTMRIQVEEVDPHTGQTVTKQYDIPAGEVKSVYEEEFYRSWHGGEIPTKTVNGKTVPDTEAIERFAKEMDVACNDKVSTESYSDLVEAMKKSGVKDFSDVEATSLTTAHKSSEWFARAKVLEQNAGGDLDILSQAENLRAEGIRQATKQFENLTMHQAREINLARHIERAKVPDTLIQRMEVLKRVDQLPPSGISTHEAEAILKQMGTSTERTLSQFYAVTEMLNKWK